jgi:hypothetical protein
MMLVAHKTYKNTKIGTVVGGFTLDADGVLQPQPTGVFRQILASHPHFKEVAGPPSAPPAESAGQSSLPSAVAGVTDTDLPRTTGGEAKHQAATPHIDGLFDDLDAAPTPPAKRQGRRR